MKHYRLTRPPSTLRHANLDNLAFVPASLLPYKKQWQAIANGLSKEGVLIILPASQRAPRRILQTVASLLHAHGHRVTTLPAEQLL